MKEPADRAGGLETWTQQSATAATERPVDAEELPTSFQRVEGAAGRPSGRRRAGGGGGGQRWAFGGGGVGAVAAKRRAGGEEKLKESGGGLEAPLPRGINRLSRKFG